MELPASVLSKHVFKVILNIQHHQHFCLIDLDTYYRNVTLFISISPNADSPSFSSITYVSASTIEMIPSFRPSNTERALTSPYSGKGFLVIRFIIKIHSQNLHLTLLTLLFYVTAICALPV